MKPTVRALLLTDVVDSTRITQTIGDARAAEIWAAHDRAARDLLVAHRGREIDRTDGFLHLFEEARDAVGYALDYHRAMATLSGAQGVAFRGRAGIHVGEVILIENPPEDVARGAKPIEVEGIAKPLAARIMSLARGGQTLLSPSAREGLGDLPEGAEVESHGHYRLKGVEEPVELFEVGRRGESPFAPPPDAEKAYRVVWKEEMWRPVREVPRALPEERDAFVGREEELHSLARKLGAGARLVTVLGTGGTGKSRLVRRYGWTWLGDWPGGVWFCDVSEARAPEGLATAVAGALDVPLGKEDPILQLGHAIAGRGRCLLILDGFEQLVREAGATLGRWLERAKEASFLVTSRERLHLEGEDVLPLEPLPVDGAGVDLFIVRARAQRADFTLTPETAPVVREVVRLLDGLPLAIELAAARARVLSPAQLLPRLKDRFHLLAGARGAKARQATLRAAIDWSWGLLEPAEQAALAQASVFEGGFTLEAAEAVLDVTSFPEAPWAMDLVQSLVDKSLLRTWTTAEEPYFGMYVSIQEYAAEKLRSEGALPAGGSGADAERAAIERHGEFFAHFGGEGELEALNGHGGVARRKALGLALGNLVAASRRAVARGDGPTATAALRAACAVLDLKGPFSMGVDLGLQVLALPSLGPAERAMAHATVGRALSQSGGLREARGHYESALAVHRERGERLAEGGVLAALGLLSSQEGRPEEARGQYEAALAIHRELGHRRAEGNDLGNLALLDTDEDRAEDARQHYEAALAILREVGDRLAEGNVLGNLGNLHARCGRRAEAHTQYEAALAIHREVGHRRFEGIVLGNLGAVAWQEGKLEEARERYEAALAIQREVGDRRFEGIVLGNLAVLHVGLGRMEEARAHYEAALAIHQEGGNRRAEGTVLGNLGNLHVRQGRPDDARTHYEAALAIHREVGDRREEGIVLANLGALEAGEGRAEEARTHFESALAIHRSLGDHRTEGAILGYLGDLHLQQGRIGDARTALDGGAALLREAGDLLELGELLCTRARCEEAAGDRAAAASALAEAEALARRAGAGPDSPLGRKIVELLATIEGGADPSRGTRG